MTNLEYFINGEYHRDFDKKVDEDKELFDHQIDSLLRIAIMHAQFESIHPFLDGNGRLGRILIVLMAIKEKIMEAPLFFQAVDKCRNCMSQQPILMRKSAKNVII